MRANLRDDMGDHDQALADYDRALSMGDNGPDVYHDRAISWLRRGAFDKALVDLDHAIRFTFSDARIYSEPFRDKTSFRSWRTPMPSCMTV
jgi:hypothetical protein